jgi:hypothetical protein
LILKLANRQSKLGVNTTVRKVVAHKKYKNVLTLAVPGWKLEKMFC